METVLVLSEAASVTQLADQLRRDASLLGGGKWNKPVGFPADHLTG